MIDNESTTNNNSNKTMIAVPSVSFDIVKYISKYEGYTKIQRLLWISEHSAALKYVALEHLLIELKKSTSTTMLYTRICEKTEEMMGYDFPMKDTNWPATADALFYAKCEKLESELNIAKSTMSKDSMRLKYSDLGSLQAERGNFTEALKYYFRAKEYCTFPSHQIEVWFHIITASIDSGNIRFCPCYVDKILSLVSNMSGGGGMSENMSKTNTNNEMNIMKAKCQIVLGLSSLYETQYKSCADSLLDIYLPTATASVTRSEQSFHHYLSLEDIAVYGTLCAMATYSRQEVRRKVLENNNSQFKLFLEITPVLKKFVHDYLEGQYQACFQFLQAISTGVTGAAEQSSITAATASTSSISSLLSIPLSLDIHFHAHIQPIAELIQEKILLQYIIPYTVVDLVKMAEVMKMGSYEQLERAIVAQIHKMRIHGKINSITKTLHRDSNISSGSSDTSTTALTRRELLDKIKNSLITHRIERDFVLLRLSMQKHGFMVTECCGTDSMSDIVSGSSGSNNNFSGVTISCSNNSTNSRHHSTGYGDFRNNISNNNIDTSRAAVTSGAGGMAIHIQSNSSSSGSGDNSYGDNVQMDSSLFDSGGGDNIQYNQIVMANHNNVTSAIDEGDDDNDNESDINVDNE